MNLKKVAYGISEIRSISVGITHNREHGNLLDYRCEITFYRVKNSLLGGHSYSHRSYVRKSTDKYTTKFRYKCEAIPFIYSADNWLINFHPKNKLIHFSSNWIILIYLLYAICSLLK